MNNDIVTQLTEWITLYGLRILAAIVILVVGRWIAKAIRHYLSRILTKRNVDAMLVSFLSSLTYIALMAFIVIAAMSKLGIETTSFIAVLGAAGLAIGLALQGSLANFAAGFLMIIFRPFKKGDYIEGAGTAGIVQDIHVFTTILHTPDNKKVIIPNSKMMGDNITNYSATGTRRMDWIFGVSYSADLTKVRQVLQRVIESESRFLSEPAPMIAVKELADSSVNFVLRGWVNTSDYWDVYFETVEKVKRKFDQADIEIPFPQRDVHLYQAAAS